MGWGKKFRFEDSVETDRGVVLQRDNGTVIPAEEIFLYPISYFHGRDMVGDPVPEGTLAAWVFGYEGANVRPAPSMDAEVAKVLPYHEPLWVQDEPADERGDWWEIPDALGPGVSGYVHDQVDIRHWVPRERPAEVGPDEVWVDVDLDQQVLAVLAGDQPTFITLVSTGDVDWATPQGIFRIYDKMIETTMASRAGPEDDEYYYVEGVPWTMHFKPRYALHGVFWHWGFGHRASHGCINLAPRDAKYVFDHVGPTMEAGWHTSFETPSDPGTLMRVRTNQRPVTDRRASLR
jgi:lipoprotein-anchoring transpeptidase ErfK/SrfK